MSLVLQYQHLTRGKSKGEYYGEVGKLCKSFGVSRGYARKWSKKAMDQVSKGKSVELSDVARTGRPSVITDELAKRVEEVARSLEDEFTYDEISIEIPEVSRSSLWRLVKRYGWREVKRKTKPSLSQRQKDLRYHWAVSNTENDWTDYVDVDEKWFFTKELGRKVKVPPGRQARCDKPQHRSHVPKVMFLSAVARPRSRYGFDGKVGLWRIALPYQAMRKSKHHRSGEVYEKDVTLNASRFQKFMTQKVFRAIRKKMWYAKNVVVQVDGASPHTGQGTIAFLNAKANKVKKGPRITVVVQPPQSPDTNVNDLAFFNSLASRVRKYQRRASIFDLNKLVRNVKKVWKKYPSSTLNKSFDLKSVILKSIIYDDGGNDYLLPHSNMK